MNFKWNNDRWHGLACDVKFPPISMTFSSWYMFLDPFYDGLGWQFKVSKSLAFCKTKQFLFTLQNSQIESKSFLAFFLLVGHFCFDYVRTWALHQFKIPHEISNVFHVHSKINCLSMYLKTQTTEVINLKCESCDILRKSLYPTPNRNVSNAKIAWCFFFFFFNIQWI